MSWWEECETLSFFLFPRLESFVIRLHPAQKKAFFLLLIILVSVLSCHFLLSFMRFKLSALFDIFRSFAHWVSIPEVSFSPCSTMLMEAVTSSNGLLWTRPCCKKIFHTCCGGFLVIHILESLFGCDYFALLGTRLSVSSVCGFKDPSTMREMLCLVLLACLLTGKHQIILPLIELSKNIRK